MKEAYFYQRLEENKVRCMLCPRHCTIKDKEIGFCNTRQNIAGKLYSLVYGKPCAVHVDPIEKKPFYQFLPGTKSFSIGTIGCNLDCKNCQNWDLARGTFSRSVCRELEPEKVVELAKKNGCATVSYTYNEPTVFFEMMVDTAKAAKKENIKNVVVTNGYIDQEPLKMLCEHIDAFSVDLKSIEDGFYRTNCNGRLEPVLQTLLTLKKKRKYLEITNLMIPGLNDSIKQVEKLVLWIKENMGSKTPLHLSRFFPHYRLTGLSPTSEDVIIKARELAMEHLDYVYTGNMLDPKGANTYCPKCKKLLIGRSGFGILINKVKNGRCECGQDIRGVFEK